MSKNINGPRTIHPLACTSRKGRHPLEPPPGAIFPSPPFLGGWTLVVDFSSMALDSQRRGVKHWILGFQTNPWKSRYGSRLSCHFGARNLRGEVSGGNRQPVFISSTCGVQLRSWMIRKMNGGFRTRAHVQASIADLDGVRKLPGVRVGWIWMGIVVMSLNPFQPVQSPKFRGVICLGLWDLR